MDEPKKVSELTQTAGPFRRHDFTLYEDRLELCVTSLLERYRLPFYLHSIKEEPDRVREVRWLWVGFTVAALVGACWLGTAAGSLDRALGAGLGILGLSAAVVQALRARLRLVYAYRSLGPGDRFEPHLYLWPDRPSSGEARRFLDQFAAVQRRHIERLRSEQEGEGGVAYARELERFATLREREVISEHEFVQVKAKLLNLKPRRIGF